MQSADAAHEAESQSIKPKERWFVDRVLEDLNDIERYRVMQLFERLVDIRNSDVGTATKVREALVLPELQPAAVILVTRVPGEVKDFVWDDRGWGARLGLSAAAVTAIATGGAQSAGIALLGTAFGIPLSVLFGAGGTVAGVLIDEVKNSLPDGFADRVADRTSAIVRLHSDEQEALAELPVRAIQLVQAIEDADSGQPRGRPRFRLGAWRLVMGRLPGQLVRRSATLARRVRKS